MELSGDNVEQLAQGLDQYGPLGDYLMIFILIAVAILLSWILTNASWLLGPSRPNAVKEGVYESGMDPVGVAHQRFSVKFYMVAMLFILFDIEIVFMYPWAVQFKEVGMLMGGGNGMSIFPLLEMFVFVVILFVGYIYVWKKGGLEWN